MADETSKGAGGEEEPLQAQMAVSSTPRFFVELNEPFSIYGLNPEGLAVPFVASAIFIGLGFWLGVLGALIGGIYLCRRMAVNPTVLKELVARYHRSKHVVPNPEDGAVEVRIIAVNGQMGVGQWLAERVHLRNGESALSGKAKRRRI